MMNRHNRLYRASTMIAVFLLFFSSTVFFYHNKIGFILWNEFRFDNLSALLNNKDAKLHFDIGNYYFGGGAYDTKKAEKYFKKTLEIDPMFQGAHYQLARIYFVQSNFTDALFEINKEIELHPDFKRSYYVRGLINGYGRLLADAESDFKEFLAWKPDSWAGHNDLAWVYFQEGKYKEARGTVLEALKTSPQNVWLLNSLGVSLLNMGDRKGAEETLTMALKISESMTQNDWGSAYPGNDPTIYNTGFTKMKESIKTNLKLLKTVDIQ